MFDENGGRPSGYFRKFSQAIQSASLAPVEVVNGGRYADLADLVQNTTDVSHLFWFADVPNEFPKLLPGLKQRFPELTLIQSKNNRAPRQYTRAQLLERMQASASAFLLEFTLADTGIVQATLLAKDGVVAFEHQADVVEVARLVLTHVVNLPGATTGTLHA